MNLSLRIFPVLAMALCASGATDTGDSTDRLLPKDFKVVATFGSGAIGVQNGSVAGWKLVLTAEGEASQEAYVFPNHTRRKKTRVSKDVLLDVAHHIREAKFFALPADMAADASDVPTYVLEITMNGLSHSVRVFGPAYLKDKAALRRFVEVWASLVQNMPSPNKNRELTHLRANI